MFFNPICNCICCCIVIVLQNKIACHLIACVGFHCLWYSCSCIQPLRVAAKKVSCTCWCYIAGLARRKPSGLSHTSQLIPVPSRQMNHFFTAKRHLLQGNISLLCVNTLFCPLSQGASLEVRSSITLRWAIEPSGQRKPTSTPPSPPSSRWFSWWPSAQRRVKAVPMAAAIPLSQSRAGHWWGLCHSFVPYLHHFLPLGWTAGQPLPLPWAGAAALGGPDAVRGGGAEGLPPTFPRASLVRERVATLPPGTARMANGCLPPAALRRAINTEEPPTVAERPLVWRHEGGRLRVPSPHSCRECSQPPWGAEPGRGSLPAASSLEDSGVMWTKGNGTCGWWALGVNLKTNGDTAPKFEGCLKQFVILDLFVCLP